MFPKQLEIISKDRAPQFKSNESWAAISIAARPNWPDLQSDNRCGLLRVTFSDYSYRDFFNISLYGVKFDKPMAFQILEFIDSMWDRAESFLITSERGESRAPAVAAAICRTRWGAGWERYFLDHYKVNYLVYHMLLKAHFDPCGHML